MEYKTPEKPGKVGMKKPVKAWDFWEEIFDWGNLGNKGIKNTESTENT